AAIMRRPDGSPEVVGCPDVTVSAAHAGDLTLAVAGEGRLACDLEPVTARPAALWRDLLGPERLTLAESLARQRREDLDTAATRVWCAAECLRKAGLPVGAPLSAAPGDGHDGGAALLASGGRPVATFLLSVRGTPAPLVA